MAATERTFCRDGSTACLRDVNLATIDSGPVPPVDIERECLGGSDANKSEHVEAGINDRCDRRDLEQCPLVHGQVLCQSRHRETWGDVIDRDRVRTGRFMRAIFVHDSNFNRACTVVGIDMGHSFSSVVSICKPVSPFDDVTGYCVVAWVGDVTQSERIFSALIDRSTRESDHWGNVID